MALRANHLLSDSARYRSINALPFAQGVRNEISRLLDDTQFAYKSADQAFTSDTTLANDNHLIFNMIGGGVYLIELNYFTTSTTNGGVKIDLDGGTATAATLRATYERIEAAALAASQVSALATDSTGTTNVLIARVTGLMIVNVGGSFIPRIAQNASHADTTTYLTGSWGRLTRIASA